MKYLLSILFCVLISATVVSCKNDTKNPEETKKSVKTKKEKKVLTEIEKEQLKSITARMMATQEIKTMSRYFVASGLGQYFMNEKGPFTVFAPTNEALTALPEAHIKTLSNPKNKEQLEQLLKGHVVPETIDSKALVQRIRDNGGSLELTALSGDVLTVSMSGTNIVLKNKDGVSATVVMSDINASNGVIHTLDKVLTNKTVEAN